MPKGIIIIIIITKNDILHNNNNEWPLLEGDETIKIDMIIDASIEIVAPTEYDK